MSVRHLFKLFSSLAVLSKTYTSKKKRTLSKCVCEEAGVLLKEVGSLVPVFLNSSSLSAEVSLGITLILKLPQITDV